MKVNKEFVDCLCEFLEQEVERQYDSDIMASSFKHIICDFIHKYSRENLEEFIYQLKCGK